MENMTIDMMLNARIQMIEDLWRKVYDAAVEADDMQAYYGDGSYEHDGACQALRDCKDALMQARVVNLTPHDINMVMPDGHEIVFHASGFLARCKTETVDDGYFYGLPLSRTRMGEVEGLPDAVRGVLYIVSRAVAEAVPERDDVRIPDRTVRNEKGQVVACRAFGHV